MKRKLLKISVLVLIIVSVFLIYRYFYDNRINCVEINIDIKKEYKVSNKKYYKKYTLSIKNIIDLIKYDNIIKKELRESNLVVIQLEIKDDYNEYKKLLKEIRKYAQEEVRIIAYYKENLISNYLNNKYKEIANRYNCQYIRNNL